MEEDKNIPEENSKKQITNFNEESVNKNIPQQEVIEQPVTHNSKLQTENMEVHHHPKVEKKNLKEYLLEGLMIFLAVTMGFFAENLREHITEATREKEFAQELYIELKDDSTVVANKIALRLQKEKDLDYLYAYFKDSSLTRLSKEFYPAFIRGFYLINSFTFEPKDGILGQLRNSGAILSFRNTELQKMLGNISVSINNIRYRNEQEYQYFANPLKPFTLEHLDFNWYNNLRKLDADTSAVNVLNRYLKSDKLYEAKILHVETVDRPEAANIAAFNRQMSTSTRTLQINNYINLNHEILELLRKNYALENEQ